MGGSELNLIFVKIGESCVSIRGKQQMWSDFKDLEGMELRDSHQSLVSFCSADSRDRKTCLGYTEKVEKIQDPITGEHFFGDVICEHQIDGGSICSSVTCRVNRMVLELQKLTGKKVLLTN